MQFKNKLLRNNNSNNKVSKPKPVPFAAKSSTKPAINTTSTTPSAPAPASSSRLQNLIKFAEAKPISARRKAYHKRRDERKKSKKLKAQLEHEHHSTGPTIRSVRDVVQEPPRLLARPKKVFKKEVASSGAYATDSDGLSELSGFSDFDGEAVDFGSDLE